METASHNPRRLLAVSRDKHKGISFVNATAAGAETIPSDKSRGPVPKVRFVSVKPSAPKAPPKPVTEADLERAQEGSNRRIAPKSQGDRRAEQALADASSVIPYHSVANGSSDASFCFQLVRAWRAINQNGPCPSPNQFTLPDWAYHGLPADISDDGKKCFHAYLFSCPVRHYPFEQANVVSWQPLARDQARFERLLLEPAMLRSTLTMGALFLLLKSGKRESAGFALHSAKLCALVNKMLADDDNAVHKKIVVIQSVATLAIQATFLGLYDHWFAHVKGLKLLVQQSGGMEVLPLPVQLLVKKADLKGASEIVTMPLFEFGPLQESISNSLPLNQQMVITTAVRRALGKDEGHDGVCDTMVSLAIFVATINFAEMQRGKMVFDPLPLMEEFHSIEYRLLAIPGPIQSHSGALQRASGLNSVVDCRYQYTQMIDPKVEARKSLQILLRLAALFYLKLAKGGPTDTLDGPIYLLDLFYTHLRRVTYLPSYTANSSVHGLSKSALIWIFLIADRVARESGYESWNWGSRGIDCAAGRDFLHWMMGGLGEDEVEPIGDHDLDLYWVLDFRRFQARTWDPRAHIRRVLKSRQL
ncbi:hypothetical protein ACJZ2D_003746 [Fusarium nematophilum]